MLNKTNRIFDYFAVVGVGNKLVSLNQEEDKCINYYNLSNMCV